MGHWKFNASLLKDDEYTNSLRINMYDWSMKYKHIASKQLYWELIKYKVNNYPIQYSKQKKENEESGE